MEDSLVLIYRGKDRVGRHYSGLNSNKEVAILTWLHQQGVGFESIMGIESHDIGDEDYDREFEVSDELDDIARFVNNLYGEWSLDATYQGIRLKIKKEYPNINTGLSFYYPRINEDALIPLFHVFQEKFCYSNITIGEQER